MIKKFPVYHKTGWKKLECGCNQGTLSQFWESFWEFSIILLPR